MTFYSWYSGKLLFYLLFESLRDKLKNEVIVFGRVKKKKVTGPNLSLEPDF